MPRPTTTRPGQQFGPPTTGAAAPVELGGTRIDIVRVDEHVEITTADGEARPLRFGIPGVVRWCDDAALLLGSSLDVDARDEVELRTPLLVALDGRCLALSRRITSSGSTMMLLRAASEDRLADAWRSAPDAPAAAHVLLRALRKAAG